MLQQEGSLGSGHYVLEDESVRRVPDGAFHGGRPDSLSREQGMQDAGNGSHVPFGGRWQSLCQATSSSEALNLVRAHLLLLKWPQLCFLCFQSETSFHLISEKCDILSILRDHPENRIYQRKIQVRTLD